MIAVGEMVGVVFWTVLGFLVVAWRLLLQKEGDCAT